MGFEEFAETYEVYTHRPGFKKYEKVGFATPSGKVELKSSVLESLGFDPLPYYRPDPPADPEYPLMMFTGVREDEYFQTGGRHIPELRKRKPEPVLFVSLATAARAGVVEGKGSPSRVRPVASRSRSASATACRTGLSGSHMAGGSPRWSRVSSKSFLARFDSPMPCCVRTTKTTSIASRASRT